MLFSPLPSQIAAGLPIFAVGNVPVAALARLLETLAVGEDGDTHVLVTDVVYCFLLLCPML